MLSKADLDQNDQLRFVIGAVEETSEKLDARAERRFRARMRDLAENLRRVAQLIERELMPHLKLLADFQLIERELCDVPAQIEAIAGIASRRRNYRDIGPIFLVYLSYLIHAVTGYRHHYYGELGTVLDAAAGKQLRAKPKAQMQFEIRLGAGNANTLSFSLSIKARLSPVSQLAQLLPSASTTKPDAPLAKSFTFSSGPEGH